MDAKQFADAVRSLQSIPAEKRQKLLAVGENLSSEDRERIVAHLRAIAKDLDHADQKHASSGQRQELMVDHVKQHDIPVLDALLRSE